MKNKSNHNNVLYVIFYYLFYQILFFIKFYRVQHAEIYLLDLKVQYKHKMKLSLAMVSKHIFLYYRYKTSLKYQTWPKIGTVSGFIQNTSFKYPMT